MHMYHASDACTCFVWMVLYVCLAAKLPLFSIGVKHTLALGAVVLENIAATSSSQQKAVALHCRSANKEAEHDDSFIVSKSCKQSLQGKQQHAAVATTLACPRTFCCLRHHCTGPYSEELYWCVRGCRHYYNSSYCSCRSIAAMPMFWHEQRHTE
jgi:hypothetical protein